uniref:Glutathione transferase n=1 Tax=Octactis speculum TaxID=3111310 RepID=A0A7S2BLR8_9STRA
MAIFTNLSTCLEMEIPASYGLLFIPLALSWLVNIFLTVMVGNARKKYDVQYPNLYAPADHKDAVKFNCVQRAHQNTLESWAPVMVTMFATGLVYPVSSSISGVIWCMGRVVYGIGYSFSPSLRLPGGLLTHVGDFPLMVMAIRIAWETLNDGAAMDLVKGVVSGTGAEL